MMRNKDNKTAMKNIFVYSIGIYNALFAALLIDHYLRFYLWTSLIHEQTPHPEHPCAEYISHTRKAKKASRTIHLQEWSLSVMQMILAGEVLQVQLGAFLMFDGG